MGSVHYEAAGGVVMAGNRVLVLRRPARGEVRLPKGHIKPPETAEGAARRETCEETGLRSLATLADLGQQRVEFDYQSEHVVRDEHYFLFGAHDSTPPCEPEAQFEPLWLTWSQASEALTFAAEREWLRRAHRAWLSLQGCPKPAIAVSTGSLYTYGIGRAFQMAARVGFDGVEVLIDHRWDSRQPEYLRALAAECGIPITSVHSPFVPSIRGWPADELGRLRSTVALARALGVNVVVAHLALAANRIVLGWHGRRRWDLLLPLPQVRRSEYARFLETQLAGFEHEHGVMVCVENMPARHVAGIRINAFRSNSPEQLRTFAHLTLDTTHLCTWNLDPADVYATLRDRVAHVHISNYEQATGVGHRAPQDGDADLALLLHRLADDRYDGAVVLEANPETLRAADPSECERRLVEAVQFCRRHLAGHWVAA
jgi:sugar phosphate isomerase/epimerase/8-oxo-dGTP pyrophosphatase MutT (NUDIX family)